MKARHQTEPTPKGVTRRNLTTRTAAASRAPQREQAADKNAIRPFHVDVQEAELTELRFAASVFPDELYPAPRSWTERAFPGQHVFQGLAEQGLLPLDGSVAWQFRPRTQTASR